MASGEEQQRQPAPAYSTVLAAFLALRSLPPASPPRRIAAPTAPNARSARAPPVLWKRFTKRAHGERVAALRNAMRTPDDDSGASRDAYNPRKPRKRFVQLHAEEEATSADFLAHTRAMHFEREVVDRDVADRLENRRAYDARLLELYRRDYE